MKKTFALLLAATLLITAAFAGCTPKKEQPTSEQPETVQETTLPVQTTQASSTEPSLPRCVPIDIEDSDILPRYAE